MKKENLIARAERWQKLPQQSLLMRGYPRDEQGKIPEMSVAVIKAICETKAMSLSQIKYALKLATEIIEQEIEHEVIL